MENREYYSYNINQPKNREIIKLQPFNSIKPCDAKEGYNNDIPKSYNHPMNSSVNSYLPNNQPNKNCQPKNPFSKNAWVGIL